MRYRGAGRTAAHSGFLVATGELVILNPGSATIPAAPDQRLVPTDDRLVFTIEGGRPAGESLVFRIAKGGKVVGFLMSHAWAYRKMPPITE